MTNKMRKQSVILLVKECAEEKGFVKNWLEKNNFLTRETTDVFEALEEITDFTVSRCPDVVLLSVNSPAKDFDRISETIQLYTNSSEISVITLSGEISNHKNYFNQQLSETGTNLGGLLPALSRTASEKVL